MKNIFQFSSVIFISMILISCSKHKDDFVEPVPVATIKFESPVAQFVYAADDSISIKAQAVSTETIHGYDLSIKKVNDTACCFFAKVHDHNASINIDQKWKSEVAEAADMEAIITLYVDHEGHTKTEKVAFRIQ